MIQSPRMFRSSVVLCAVLLVALPASGSAPPAVAQESAQEQAPAGGQVPPLRPPVEAPVVTGFDLSEGPFGPGVRGVKLAAPGSSPVAASAPGTVTFAGYVAGLGWVTVAVAPGVLVSVGPLDRIAVRAGDEIGGRAVLGRLQQGHPAHLGLRVGGAYVDPLPHLSRVGPPRLAPLPGGG